MPKKVSGKKKKFWKNVLGCIQEGLGQEERLTTSTLITKVTCIFYWKKFWKNTLECVPESFGQEEKNTYISFCHKSHLYFLMEKILKEYTAFSNGKNSARIC